MAGGKMSARQKMINLMYLVFIAMLALNMSKEVLSAFGYTKEDLEKNTGALNDKNKTIYDALNTNAKGVGKAKYGRIKERADSVKEVSSIFYKYLDSLKTEMLSTIPLKDRTNYSRLDVTDWTSIFFNGDTESKYTPVGDNFINHIKNYKEGISSVLIDSFPELSKTITDKFSTDDRINNDNKSVKYLIYNYENMPMIATLTNFTLLQSKIITSENDILNTLLGGQDKTDLDLGNSYKGIVRLDNTTIYKGQNVTGQVVLARYDQTLIPKKVMLGDQDITADVVDGQVMLNFPANGRFGVKGTNSLSGEITFEQNGNDKIIEFSTDYEVTDKPNKAVISAEKMNVVYRGIENPISVSFPGLTNFNVNFNNVSSKKGSSQKGYLIIPGDGEIVTVKATGRLDNGDQVSDEKKFKVKNIPPAEMIVYGPQGAAGQGRSGSKMSLSKAAFVSRIFKVGMVDFDFDLNIETVKFDIAVGSGRTITVEGEKLNSDALRAITAGRRGDKISIFNIVAKVSGSNYQLDKVYGGTIRIR